MRGVDPFPDGVCGVRRHFRNRCEGDGRGSFLPVKRVVSRGSGREVGIRGIFSAAIPAAVALCSAGMLPAGVAAHAGDLEEGVSRKGAQESFFGINGVSFFHYWKNGDALEVARRRIEWMRKAGARWDRFDFWWGTTEPERGRYDWRAADTIVSLYEEAGIAMMPILCYASAWSGGVAPADGAERDRYAAWVKTVVGRYRDRIHVWEIWNEPNIRPFWTPDPNPESYAELLKKAYAAAKEADPDCTVVGGVTSLTDLPFLDVLGRRGALKAMDVLSIHPYSLAGGPVEAHLDQQVRLVRRLLDRYGVRIPIWITEIGWKADPSDPEAVKRQSAYLAQTMAMMKAEGVERLFWFNLVDWSEKWGIVSQDGKPKRSFAAYRQAVEMLEGAEYAGCPRFEGVRARAFRSSRGDLLVLWTSTPEKATWDPGELRVAEVRDAWGEPVESQDGLYRVDTAPLYVRLEDGAPLDLLPRAPAPENWVVNGDFELGEGNDPYGWQRGSFIDKKLQQGRFAWIRAEGGRNSSVVKISHARNAAWESFHIPVMPGALVRASARVRCEGATGESRIELLMLGGSGWPFRGLVASDPVSGNGDWTKIAVEGRVPEDASYLRVRLASRKNRGRVFFDGVEVTIME